MTKNQNVAVEKKQNISVAIYFSGTCPLIASGEMGKTEGTRVDGNVVRPYNN